MARRPQQRVVVVGNGPVGFSLLEPLVAAERFRLVVYGDELVPAYDRVHLSECFEGRTLQDLSLASRRWYAERGIRLFTGTRITSIDRGRRLVRTSDGWSTDYDWLVLATGARARRPAIPGIDVEGVFTYRTAADLGAIEARARGSAERAAVIGGGVLGLEVAQVLADLGLETTLVASSPHLMSRQLDAGASAVLRNQIEIGGVQARVGQGVRALHAIDDRLVLSFAADDFLSVDFVVVAAGIEPRDELARAAELAVAEEGGIVVDDHLLSSDPRIFAIGDCARHRGVCYGQIEPGRAMARVVAERLTGGRARFEGMSASCRLRVGDVDVASMGRRPERARRVAACGDDWHRELYLDGDRLVGATAVGAWRDLWRIDASIADATVIDAVARTRFRKTGELWPADAQAPIATWPAEAVVCACARVTRGTLSQVVASGCRTVDGLSRVTGAAATCGSCRHLVAELCGQTERPRAPGGSRALAWLSAAAAAATAAFVSYGPLPDGVSAVFGGAPIVDRWAEPATRRLTGFILLGVVALTLVLPLRKRISRLRVGGFGWFRVFHAGVGLLCVGLAAAHTGLRTGVGVHAALITVFLGVVATGGAVGLVAAAETRPEWSCLARRWRRRVAWAHWLLLWLLPVLIGFHVLAVYYY